MPNDQQLAVLGGSPRFTRTLHVGRPNIGGEEAFAARVRGIFARNWLTNHGECVREFEQRLEAMLDVPHCVTVCNATTGLQIAAKALNLSGEVIMPSFTFVATAHAFKWIGLEPVFCDIDPATHLIEPGHVERLITPRTSAIVGVHLWGQVCDVSALAEIAARHQLKLIFDAAHAFGSVSSAGKVGAFGDAEVFSFHATKLVNTFEGGAVTTKDNGTAERLKRMANFGFETYDTVSSTGTNGKMSEVSAAMGLVNLDTMNRYVEANLRNDGAYMEGLSAVPGIRILPVRRNGASACPYVVAEVDEAEFGLTRDELVEVLWAEEVRARRYFYPGCHMMEPYASLEPSAATRLPATAAVASRVLVLPTGTGVTCADVGAICAVLRAAQGNSAAVRQALEALR